MALDTKQYQRDRRAANPEHVRDIERRSRYKLKMQVIEHYGGACQCCGESTVEFLSIDHIDGNGAAHRKELGKAGGGRHFYEWLKRNNFPEGYQVLCMNCNCAKGFYGYCPHEGGSRFGS